MDREKEEKKMTKKDSLNLLKLDSIERLTQEEKVKHINLLKKEGLSERAIAAKIDVARSTLNDWLNPERNQRYTNEEKKLGSLLASLKNMTDPDISIEKLLLQIEREIIRVKDLIRRKRLNK